MSQAGSSRGLYQQPVRGGRGSHSEDRGRGVGYRGGQRGWRGGGYRGGRGWWRGSRGQWRGARGGGRGCTADKCSQSAVTRPRLVQTTLVTLPYKHWTLYLLNEGYSDSSSAAFKVKWFVKYFTARLKELSFEDIELNRSLPLNCSDLLSDPELCRELPSLADDIKNHPELVLSCLGLAFHTALDNGVQSDGQDEEKGQEEQDSLFYSSDKRIYHIRLYGHDPLTPLRSIKAPLYNKLVTVSGTVVRVSTIRPMVTKLAFQCSVCLETQVVSLPDGKYTVPTKCPTEDCRGRVFTPLRRSSLTETLDWQNIRLQEVTSDDRSEAGRVPRTIDCELCADLVDSCVPGDVVTITAVVKATGSHDDVRPRGSKDKCVFLLYLKAVCVLNNNLSDDGSGPSHINFTTKDYYAIQEIHSDKNVFKLIVGSLCPTIYGHEMVKAGLVLALFGGRQNSGDNEVIGIRGNPHVLVVGDPGLGKSQMLKAAANIAPRGVYVCGNTSTTSGLTVTLAKDGAAGDYALEAGALVLGDQGCCCIDEFDKMGSQHQALLEAMEQQSISIAKAGIVCTLPARTSLLAAANPIGGHYNKAKTVSENLKMNSALLSRFDLVFILLDKPDEERDCILSEHVMSLHSGKQNRSFQRATARREPSTSMVDTSLNTSVLLLGDDNDQPPLADRLKIHRATFDPVPGQLLRKYIDYSRKYVHPYLSTEAGEVLQVFYLELRKRRQTHDCTPITTRQLESLIRLTEARARVELREVATAQDARDVVEIMKYSMHDTYSDEFGALDFQRSQHGSGMSQRSQAKRFVTHLGQIADTRGDSLFTVSQLREAAQRIGLQVRSFEDFIFSLNNQGFLLKKGPRTYQLQTAGCL